MIQYIGKVARIPDDKTIVVTNNEEVYLQTGDFISICKSDGDVKDPDTHESLGTYNIVLTNARVVSVYPKFVVCTLKKDNTPLGRFMNTEIHGLNNSEEKTVDELDIQIGDIVQTL